MRQATAAKYTLSIARCPPRIGYARISTIP